MARLRKNAPLVQRTASFRQRTTQLLSWCPRMQGEFTFSDHLRHLHEHAGDIPATLDEFGRCARCVSRGWFEVRRLIVSSIFKRS